MRLVDQWRAIVDGFPDDWDDARLLLTVDDEGDAGRAVALLGPANPGRHGKELRLSAGPRGPGASPEMVRRLLRRLDEEGITGTLELVSVGHTRPDRETERTTLAEHWDDLVGGLPEDWNDLYGEIELASTDHLDRGALLLAPLNPSRVDETAILRFRCARQFGYGASGQMVRRCLERLDAEGIRADVRILWVVSDTDPVQTQGPVWYVGGKPV